MNECSREGHTVCEEMMFSLGEECFDSHKNLANCTFNIKAKKKKKMFYGKWHSFMQHFFRTLPGQAKSSAFRLLDVLLYVPSNCAPKLSIAHLVNIFYLDKKNKT